MKQKKTVVVTFRVDETIKEKIDRMAEKREWSTSQVVESICKQYFKYRTGEEPSIKEVILEFYDRLESGLTESPYYEENELMEDVLKCLDETKNDLLNEYE